MLITKTRILFLFVITLHAVKAQQPAEIANAYYLDGEIEKAEQIYQKLSRSKKEIPVIYDNYLALLLRKQKTTEAKDLIGNAVKHYPEVLKYSVDQIFILDLTSYSEEKQKAFEALIRKNSINPSSLVQLANQFQNRGMISESILSLLAARKQTSNPFMYSMELAALYKLSGQTEKMVSEYIIYARSNPSNIRYVKNIFQQVLIEEEEQNQLEKELIQLSQYYPDEAVFLDLLLWLEIQRKNFFSASIHARALDTRSKRPGDESMRLGQLAMQNNAFEEAEEIFKYVLSRYPDSYNYAPARKLSIEAREKLLQTSYEQNSTAYRQLTKDYASLADELKNSPVAHEALRKKALIHAYYLGELDSARWILQQVITNPRTNKTLLSKIKIDLADILLYQNDPWEAYLYYSQVEKDNKYDEIGYEAKLKGAKLQYFTGNFILAKSHLSILKKATTKEIANDALNLEVFITSSLAYDSTEEVLQMYAAAELELYQNKLQSAVSKFETITNSQPNHPITDDSYWQLSIIHQRLGNTDKSIVSLKSIIEKHYEEVLADDAVFALAKLYEEKIKDISQAKEYYAQLIKDFPGSSFSTDARKQLRKIRGDLNQ